MMMKGSKVEEGRSHGRCRRFTQGLLQCISQCCMHISRSRLWIFGIGIIIVTATVAVVVVVVISLLLRLRLMDRVVGINLRTVGGGG